MKKDFLAWSIVICTVLAVLFFSPKSVNIDLVIRDSSINRAVDAELEDISKRWADAGDSLRAVKPK